MKKKISKILSLAMLVCMLAGCSGEKSNVSNVKINPKDYETDRTFITIADCTPSTESESEMELYKNLGLNTFILTEDFVPMVEDGTISNAYIKSINKAAEYGLNVWIRNMHNDPDYFELDKDKTGSDYGVEYTMQPRNITTEFSEISAVTGFYMADELFKTTLTDNKETEADESLYCAMDKMDKLIEWKNKYYPNEYWHINHVPSSSYDHWQEGDYADFIQYYVDNIIKKLTSGGRSVSLDHYPLTAAGIHENYLHDLLTCANITRDYNAECEENQKADFCICLQTFMNATNTDMATRDITSSDDVTFQMYTGMACGASMFEYFCWRTYSGFGLYGIVDETGEKRIYDYIKEGNEQALQFQKVTLAFEWKGLTVNKGIQSGKDDIFGEVDGLTTEDNGVLKSIESRYDTIVGCFKKDKQDGYMAVNYTDPAAKKVNAVTLNFEGCSQALVYTEDGTKQINLTEEGDLRLVLEPGQAAFVIPQ